MHQLPKALLFDMDGTLTEPLLDFDQIRRDMGVSGPILEALAALAEPRRSEAEAILLRHEDGAAECSALNRGCHELLDWVEAKRLGRALITRNSRSSAAAVLRRHGLGFDVLITREDGKFKPDPTPLLEACRRLGVAPEEAWMVGDGQYDVEAGCAAGVRTIWLSHGKSKWFEARPWRSVKDLHELTQFLKDCLE